MLTDPIALTTSAEFEQRIVLNSVAVGLDTVHVAAESACHEFASDSSMLAFTAWEQARAALTAAEITTSTRGITATTIAYDRNTDPLNGAVRSQHGAVRTQFVREPWRLIPVDSLRRTGYVTHGSDDSTTFYAPGIETLLSTAFSEDHCFRLGRASDSGRLALEFEPVRNRRRIPEIKGTLWIDRTSAELQRLEFRYVNISREEAEYAGGDVDFAPLKGGGWIVWRWNIRMPQLERTVSVGSFRGQHLEESNTRVMAVEVAGGAVITAMAGKDTVWSHSLVAVTGTVLDSTTRAPIRSAIVRLKGTETESRSDGEGRFRIEGVLPGSYTIEVRTPALDSINASHLAPVLVGDSGATLDFHLPTTDQFMRALCGGQRLQHPGIVVGKVKVAPGESLPRDALLTATWVVISVKDQGRASPRIGRERYSLDGRVAADGTFHLCGVPTVTDLELSAAATGLETPQPIVTRIPPSMRFTSVEVPIAKVVADAAVLAGVVFADSSSQALSGADISFVDLGKSGITNEAGLFRIAGLPAGIHRMVVRHLGFSPIDTTLTLAPHERRDIDFHLMRVATLDSVRVVAQAFELRMRSFDDHRKAGLGSFITRADLAKVNGLTTDAILQSLLARVRFVRGRSNQVWVVSSNGQQSITGRELRRPDLEDTQLGAPIACYANVYLDGQIMYGGREREPLFNVGALHADELEAVEFYAGPAETPGEYSALDATCGVLVFWTRRGS